MVLNQQINEQINQGMNVAQLHVRTGYLETQVGVSYAS